MSKTETELSLLELLEASPRFMDALRDLKRMEKYLSPAEKQRIVELVRQAMVQR